MRVKYYNQIKFYEDKTMFTGKYMIMLCGVKCMLLYVLCYKLQLNAWKSNETTIYCFMLVDINKYFLHYTYNTN